MKVSKEIIDLIKKSNRVVDEDFMKAVSLLLQAMEVIKKDKLESDKMSQGGANG